MRVGIVTPWYGNTAHLIADYARTVQGADAVVIIDNATPMETEQALRDAAQTNGWRYKREDYNTGFSLANNRGYFELVDMDVVVFANSDITLPEHGNLIESIRHDVRHGALYGPSLQGQMVAGRMLPYLEGWCIAATRETWDRVAVNPGCPWDDEAFPQPYWEDNDLCLRALRNNVSLVQTNWPIIHLGGRSAGSLARWAEAYELNRARFAGRALKALPKYEEGYTPIELAYRQHLQRSSDIQQHLPMLKALARGVVVECGTRSGVSTAAFLCGVEERGEIVISIDLADCSHLYRDHPRWSFLQGSSIDPKTIEVLRTEVKVPIDVLLLDTEHTYDHVCAELMLWAPEMANGGVILVHDTETFPGVRRAVEEFATEHGFPCTFVLPNNGMAIVEVRR